MKIDPKKNIIKTANYMLSTPGRSFYSNMSKSQSSTSIRKSSLTLKEKTSLLEYENLKMKLKKQYEKRVNLVNQKLTQRNGNAKDPYNAIHRLIQQNSIHESKEFSIIDEELQKSTRTKNLSVR